MTKENEGQSGLESLVAHIVANSVAVVFLAEEIEKLSPGAKTRIAQNLLERVEREGEPKPKHHSEFKDLAERIEKGMKSITN